MRAADFFILSIDFELVNHAPQAQGSTALEFTRGLRQTYIIINNTAPLRKPSNNDVVAASGPNTGKVSSHSA
jgi:hypothetical protein